MGPEQPDEILPQRPHPQHPPEPDEDAEPRPRPRFVLDLDGRYVVEPWRWLAFAARAWPGLVVPYAGFLLLALPLMVASCLFGPLEAIMRVPLMSGAFYVAMRALRGEPWVFTTFFVGLGRVGRLAGTSLLCWLIAAGIYVSIAGPIAAVWYSHTPPGFPWPAVYSTVLVGCANGVGWATLCYALTRLSFANSLIMEQGTGVVEACQASWRMTRGHVIGLLGYYVLLYLVGIAGLAAYGVGLFVALPLVSLAQASAYLHATGQVRPAGHPRMQDDRDLVVERPC